MLGVLWLQDVRNLAKLCFIGCRPLMKPLNPFNSPSAPETAPL